MTRLGVKLAQDGVVNPNVARLKVLRFKLAVQEKRDLATEALARWQVAVQFPKFHEKVADKPASTLLAVVTQYVEFILRFRDLLQIAAHEIEKMNGSSLVPQEQVAEGRHENRRMGLGDKMPPVCQQRLGRDAVHFCCEMYWNCHA